MRTTFLANLPVLESAILSAASNLDTEAASVWTHNQTEIRDRTALYTQWRHELVGFLGVPAGPGLDATQRIVV